MSYSNNLILGIFDPVLKKFVNTTAHQFLNDFIVVSILKGHFQGNKGYQLEILPSYNMLDYIFTGKDENIKSMPKKIIKNKSKRHIPSGMHYTLFKRDNFKCVACGRGPGEDIKLHADHKSPFSLGGLTEFKKNPADTLQRMQLEQRQSAYRYLAKQLHKKVLIVLK